MDWCTKCKIAVKMNAKICAGLVRNETLSAAKEGQTRKIKMDRRTDGRTKIAGVLNIEVFGFLRTKP